MLGAACEAISACEKGGEWLPVLQLLQQMLDESVERFHIPKPRGEQEKDMALKHWNNMMKYHERFQTSPKTPETQWNTYILMILMCLSCESITLRIRQAVGQEHSDLLCCDQRLWEGPVNNLAAGGTCHAKGLREYPTKMACITYSPFFLFLFLLLLVSGIHFRWFLLWHWMFSYAYSSNM